MVKKIYASGIQIVSGTPSNNQVLTASSESAASWQTLSTTTASGLASATTTVAVNTSTAPTMRSSINSH